MPTTIQTRQLVEQNRSREYENYVASVRMDTITFAGEALDTYSEKALKYTYHDNELWSEQGDSLAPIFDDSVSYYQRKSEADPSIAFQYRRALAERCEYMHMQRMVRGEVPNTLVVISNYPRELDGATEDIEGYQCQRRLGFIRCITRQEDGSLQMLNHSFDQSDPQAIEAMYQLMGRQVDWGRDVLEQPVQLHIEDPEARELLLDQLLYAYDSSLSQTQGGEWFAGRRPSDKSEAVAFVEAQRDLLDRHIERLIHVGPKTEAANQLRYDFVSALRRRFRGEQYVADSADSEMSGAGGSARSNGESVSGCGLTINTTESQLNESGYQIGKKNREWTFGTCRVCLRDGRIGECAVCQGCEDADNRGENLNTIAARAQAAQVKKLGNKSLQLSRSPEQRTSKTNKIALIREQYGEHAAVRQEIVIGGARQVVYDRRTNQQITTF